MAGFILSSLMGLASQILVTRAFGTGPEIDAFAAGNRLTEIIFNLMAGGALASAFIPTFTSFLTRQARHRAWHLASAIANLLIVGLGAAALLTAVFAPWLVRNILAPGFRDAGQIALTASLLRVMVISPVIFSLSGLLMGVLNAHQRFFLPAIAPGFYRLGIILGVELLAPRMGIYGLAWGVVLGAVLHFLVQLPGLLSIHPRYTLSFGLKDAAVRQVGRLMAPRLLGQAVVQINFLVNTILASSMPVGSLAAIMFALSLMIMPELVIAQAVAVASLPTFSAQVARGEMDAMRDTLGNTLRGVLFLSLPASVGLILLRRPIVALLFERGLFTAQSTELVAWALLWYAAGLLGHAMLEIIVRAFYAMYDTRTPVFVGVGAMTLNVIFSLVFAALFTRIGWAPHGGLALANSLATALEAGALFWLMRRRLGGLNLRRLGSGAFASLLASTALAAFLIGWLRLVGGQPIWLQALGGVTAGGALYWLAALALRAPEARQLPSMIFKRTR